MLPCVILRAAWGRIKANPPGFSPATSSATPSSCLPAGGWPRSWGASGSIWLAWRCSPSARSPAASPPASARCSSAACSRERGGRSGAVGTGDSGRYFSRSAAWNGVCGLWRRRRRGPGGWPRAGRMDHRALFVALDFLYQHPRGHGVTVPHGHAGRGLAGRAARALNR